MRAQVALDPRFELIDELGRGGMGVVYRARDRQRGGEVALKALREVGAAELLRLKREFRVMCNVRHPNLVRLGELVEREGGWFFTMELIDGVDLLAWVGAAAPASPTPDIAAAPAALGALRQATTQQLGSGPVTTIEPAAGRAASKRAVAHDSNEATHTSLGNGRDLARTTDNEHVPTPHAQVTAPPAHLRAAPAFDEARLREALRGVADGLAGLHSAGLVHRDIKPSNIKVDRNGRVVLLDFGVTIAFGDADSEIAGTYAYMAPEQAEGHATAASDWYAVGVMLFRAMTGYLPFPPTREGLAMKARVSPPSPDDFVRELPRDLVRLCRNLMAAEPAARATESDVRAIVGESPPLRAPAPAITPFVGRVRERERLAAIGARQREERGCQVALILGPSGVGKTALARQFLDEHVAAQATSLVLESRCDEREMVPFNALDGIVDGLARLVVRHPDRLPAPALDILRTPDAAELRRLFPVLAELAPQGRSRMAAEDSRAAATRALRGMLDAIGRETALALLIDDAQWADADSGLLLADLLAPPAPPLLLVVTARGPERPALVRGLAHVEDIALVGLDARDAIELASTIADGNTIDAAAIAREADGHPMFIAELTRFAAERRAGAGSLDDALWARACDLPAPARQLLHVVVTDTAALPRALAVTAAGLPPEDAAAAIAELRAARFIRAGDEVIEPYHDRVREALVGRLPREERAALHLVLARAFAASEAPPERLAHHWAGAGETELAARCAEAAASRAAETLAFERAAHWLAMALELGAHDPARRRSLLVARAEALTHAGHLRDAGLAFLEASRTGEQAEIEQRDLRRRAAERLLAGGYSLEGLDIARELLAEVGLAWPATRAAALRSLFVNHVQIGMSRLRWRSRADADVAPEQRLRVDTCWSTAVGLSMLDSVRGATFALRALLMSLAAGEPRRIATSLAGAAFTAAGMNQDHRLRRLTKAIGRAAAETDAPEARCYVALAQSARAYFFDNDWLATREVATRGLDLWAEAGRGHTWEVDLFEQFIGWAEATAGNYRAAADHASHVLRGARRRGDRFIEVGFRVQFPQRFLLDDRAEDGIRDVDDAIASWPVPDGLEATTNQFYWMWRSRAMLAIYAAREEADAAWLEEGRRRIEASMLWKVPAIRLDVSIWAGAWTLARAAEARRAHASTMRAHVADVRRRLKVIAASPLPARDGSLHSFRSAIAHLEGNDERAVSYLRRAIAIYDGLHSVGPAAAARWQLGRLVGGDEGHELIEQSRAWLVDIGAARPERMVAMGMPGITV